MNNMLDAVLMRIEKEYDRQIRKGSRHYVEVGLADQALKLGFPDLGTDYGNAHAIVPLKSPKHGMKVRIDGRTFVNYAQYESGIAVPEYLARSSKRAFEPFLPNDSMICNFH